MNNDILQNTQEEFGNLAPLMNVVSIAGYLNPKLVDEETVSAIARSTGTPEDLVECIVEAVDDVNDMIGNGKDEEVVLKNFSQAMTYLGSCFQNFQFQQPKKCGPVGLAKITFALNEEVVNNFSAEGLATEIATFVPVNFENVLSAIETVKSNTRYSTKQNFSRKNYNVAALGGALKNVAGQALKSLGNIKTAVANSQAGAKAIKGIQSAAKSVTESPVVQSVVKAAPGVKTTIAVGAGKGLQAVKAELPYLKEAAKTAAKEAGQLVKDVVHSPFLMGLDGELANVGRLKGQKVISQTAADFLNKVKGVRAFDLSNTTLEADIIKSGVLNTKAAITSAAKQLKNGEISQEYFRSLTKDFQNLLERNAKSLENIRGSSLKKITDLAAQNKNFIEKSANLTSGFNSGVLSAESFASQFESLLKKTSGSFKDDALYIFRNATDKGKAARDIIKTARVDSSKFAKELERISKNFDQVEQLVKTELATAVPMATSQLGASVPGKFLATLRSLPTKQRQEFVIKGVKACQPGSKAVDPLMQKANAVLKDAKSILGKTALVGIGTAIPAGAIYWGINADEDKALSVLVNQAEASKIEIKQIEHKIAQLTADLENERAALAAMPQSKKSGKYGSAYGMVQVTKHFAVPAVIAAPVAAAAKLLLFPIAPALLIGALSVAAVATVEDKLNRISYREKELEAELANLALKRNQLNMQLARIEKESKRFHMGMDYLGYNTSGG